MNPTDRDVYDALDKFFFLNCQDAFTSNLWTMVSLLVNLWGSKTYLGGSQYGYKANGNTF